MKTFLSTSVILNIILMIVIVLLRECNGPKPVPASVITKTDTIKRIDTVKVAGKTQYLPKPYQVIDTFYRDINLTKLDSARIVAEFAKLQKYNLPVMDDSNGKLNVFADVQFNKIQKWNYKAEFYPKTTIIEKNHVILTKPVNKVFVGLQTGMILPDKVILAPTVTLCTKADHMYTIGYDPFNRAPMVGILWKIRLSRARSPN